MPESTAAFRPSSAGTLRDLRENTDLVEEAAFFGSAAEAAYFAQTALTPVAACLPEMVRYADFGGAHGLLAAEVQRWLLSRGHFALTMVVDANENFLQLAARRKLAVVQANIEESGLTGLNLATMRLVNHYNSEERQVELLSAVRKSLVQGGLFASQIETGDTATCQLHTQIANLPSLNGEHICGYHWATMEQYARYLDAAGFHDARVCGFSPEIVMTTDQALATAWKRFNGKRSQALVENGNPEQVRALSLSRKLFFEEARQAIRESLEQSMAGASGEVGSLQKGEIHLIYPVIAARA